MHVQPGPRVVRLPRARPAAAAPVAAAARAHRRATVACTAASRCHYDVLGVPQTASPDAIKSAWRAAARRLHPDHNQDPGAPDAFRAARDAYKCLSDPQQRAAYNRVLQARAQRSSSCSSSYSSSAGGGRRTQRRYTDSEYTVIYDYVTDEDLQEVDLSGFETGAPGLLFYGWYATSGSWQSSWQANDKKRRAKAAQQQRQQQQQPTAAQGQQRQQWQQRQQEEVEELLEQLQPPTLGLVQQVFGDCLQHLGSLEELVHLLAALEALRQEGIQPHASMFSGWGNRSSRRAERASSSGSSSGRSRTSGSRSNTSSSNASSSSSSSTYAGRRSGTTTSSRSNGGQRPGNSSNRRSSSASSSRSSSKLPLFEELSHEALYELMTDWTHPKQARAARSWMSRITASDPAAAARWAGMWALDFLTADFDDADDAKDSDPLRGSSWNPWEAHPERTKHRSKPASGIDYVVYADEDDDGDDDDDSDGDDDGDGWIGLDQLFGDPDWWLAEPDDDDEDEDD